MKNTFIPETPSTGLNVIMIVICFKSFCLKKLNPTVQKLSYKFPRDFWEKNGIYRRLFHFSQKILQISFMRACIVGGGLTGLVAAHALAGTHEVDLFESRSRLGGCLSSYEINGYSIEQYYHHCFSSDTHFFSLLKELHLSDSLEWLKGTTGYYVDGTIHPLNTPYQILKYPCLSLLDKAKLAYLTLRAKSMQGGDLDTIPAEEFIRKSLGDSIYSSFFEPLLNSKFGENKKNVSAAWLISRIAIRSNRGPTGERLGYLKGGFHQLIDALERSVKKKNGRVFLQSPVTSVLRVNGSWDVNGTRYDTVISTIPPQEFKRLGGPEVHPIPYQGAACMTIGLSRGVTGGIYWVNMKDPAPYGAVISHTDFVPKERYGEHIIYLASYFGGALPQNLDRQMLLDFCRRFSVMEKEIHWTRMAVNPFAGPVYTLGYRSLIPQYAQDGLFMAGMFSLPNYPERSMEGAVRAGYEVAARVTGVNPVG
jgi:protoporphyrinogen oxidase